MVVGRRGHRRVVVTSKFPTHIPLRRQEAAISAATVPPFWPETGENAVPGGEPAVTAVSSSNGADSKFTENGLSEVVEGQH